MSSIIQNAIRKRRKKLKERVVAVLDIGEKKEIQKAELLQRLLFRRTAEALIDGKRNFVDYKKPSKGMKVKRKKGVVISTTFSTNQSIHNADYQRLVNNLREQVLKKRLSRKKAIEILIRERENVLGIRMANRKQE